MDNDETTPQVTCPGCGELAWVHDGFAIYADGPRMEVARVRPATGRPEAWMCAACGHAPGEAAVRAALRALERVHEHWAARS